MRRRNDIPYWLWKMFRSAHFGADAGGGGGDGGGGGGDGAGGGGDQGGGGGGAGSDQGGGGGAGGEGQSGGGAGGEGQSGGGAGGEGQSGGGAGSEGQSGGGSGSGPSSGAGGDAAAGQSAGGDAAVGASAGADTAGPGGVGAVSGGVGAAGAISGGAAGAPEAGAPAAAEAEAPASPDAPDIFGALAANLPDQPVPAPTPGGDPSTIGPPSDATAPLTGVGAGAGIGAPESFVLPGIGPGDVPLTSLGSTLSDPGAVGAAIAGPSLANIFGGVDPSAIDPGMFDPGFINPNVQGVANSQLGSVGTLGQTGIGAGLVDILGTEALNALSPPDASHVLPAGTGFGAGADLANELGLNNFTSAGNPATPQAAAQMMAQSINAGMTTEPGLGPGFTAQVIPNYTGGLAGGGLGGFDETSLITAAPGTGKDASSSDDFAGTPAPGIPLPTSRPLDLGIPLEAGIPTPVPTTPASSDLTSADFNPPATTRGIDVAAPPPGAFPGVGGKDAGPDLGPAITPEVPGLPPAADFPGLPPGAGKGDNPGMPGGGIGGDEVSSVLPGGVAFGGPDNPFALTFLDLTPEGPLSTNAGGGVDVGQGTTPLNDPNSWAGQHGINAFPLGPGPGEGAPGGVELAGGTVVPEPTSGSTDILGTGLLGSNSGSPLAPLSSPPFPDGWAQEHGIFPVPFGPGPGDTGGGGLLGGGNTNAPGTPDQIAALAAQEQQLMQAWQQLIPQGDPRWQDIIQFIQQHVWGGQTGQGGTTLTLPPPTGPTPGFGVAGQGPNIAPFAE